VAKFTGSHVSWPPKKDLKGGNTMGTKSARFVPSIRLEQYDVVNQKGDDMGQVQTLVMDMRAGLIAFALVSFGGFLGIGDKWFAMPWAALKWHPVTKKFTLNMQEEVLKNAPGMDKDKWLEEIEKWQEDQDLALLDRYYTSYGYASYLGIVQQRVTNLGDHKPDAKFEINKDVRGEFRFNLVATNGEIIAVSQGYNAKESALKGIESVKVNAADAVIEDNTV
jgi:uncharacterized protein YegP (UPF0339 family)/sporulation protein YlmC with PRC-barrel domain